MHYGIFHHTKKYVITITSSEDFDIIRSKGLTDFVAYLLYQKRMKPAEIVKQYGSGLLDFFAWSVDHEDCVYRGISNYSLSTLKLLVKHGNDKHGQDPLQNNDEYVYKKYHLTPSEFIWGSDHEYKGWEFATKNHKRILFCVYDKSKLEKVENWIWKLRPKVKSFEDALSVVLLIQLR